MKKHLKKIAIFIAVTMLFTSTVYAYQVIDDSTTDFEEGQMDGTTINGTALTLEYESENYDAPVSLTGEVHEQSTPQIVADSSGILYTVWSESDGGTGSYDIWFAKSEDGGATWNSKVQVDDVDVSCPGNRYKSIFPDIAIDESDTYTSIYIVWTDNRDPLGSCAQFYNNVWFAGSRDFGSSWSENVMVNNFPSLGGIGGYGDEEILYHHDENTGGPKVAVSNSHDILVTWMSDEIMPYDYDVYYSKSDNDHNSYLFDADRSTSCVRPVEGEGYFYARNGCEDAKVDDNTGNFYSGVPDIDNDGNNIVIVYEDDRDTGGMPKTNIYAASFAEYGDKISVFPTIGNELSPLTAAPYRIKERSVRVDDDNNNASKNPTVSYRDDVYVAWEETAPSGIETNGQSIYLDISQDGGANFAADAIVRQAVTASEIYSKPFILIEPFVGNYVLYHYSGQNLGQLMITNIELGSSNILAGGVSVSSAFNGNLVFDTFNQMLYAIWNDYDSSDTRQDGTSDIDVYSTRSYGMGSTFGQIYPEVSEEKMFISRDFQMRAPATFTGMKVKWSQDVSNGGQVKFQLRSAMSKENLAGQDFLGPNGAGNTYYEYNENGVLISDAHKGDSYIQYKAYFVPSATRIFAPKLYSIQIHYGLLSDENAVCSEDSDCEDGNVCAGGQCVAPDMVCDAEGECPTGYECYLPGGYCEFETVSCESDADCSVGVCLDNVCYIPEVPEGEEEAEEDEEEVEEDEEASEYEEDDRCSVFTDVSITDPNCLAIEFVYNRGIFEGYPDGTFGPDNVINRAETSKVVLEGFDKGPFTDSGTNLGFLDATAGAWYMAYVESGVMLGVLQGYPDGTLKPDNQVNRVELLKIFFKTSEDELEECGEAPYDDITLNDETSWYTPFVCFTAEYGLMDPDNENNFNPADGMTRRDVAELFYRYDTVIGL